MLMEINPKRVLENKKILIVNPRRVCISGFLILVKDNLTLWMEISGTIDPHPTLASCLSSIFIYAHWRFICLDYVVIV